jgi:hypothetical protein
LSDAIGRVDENKYQLIAPVDVDMAFAKEQAVSIWSEPPCPDEEIATMQFGAEVGSFVQDLAGRTAIIPGVSTAIEIRKQPEDPGQNELLWVARDLAAYEALKAYQEPLVDQNATTHDKQS